MKNFIAFIKEQGIVGLAIGFILGGAVSNFVSSLVNDVINPLVGLLIGANGPLTKIVLTVGPAKILIGNFLNTFIDFLIVALIVFISLEFLGLGRLHDKKP